MSFLSGIVNFGKSALGFLGGNSIASSLAKTALLGFAVNKMSKSVLKENDTKGSGGSQNIDKGVRLQVKPNAEAKIPVLYGDAYFGGNISDAAMTNANKTMWYCLTLAENTGTTLSSSSATTYTFHDVYWNQQRIVFQADGITADYAVDSNGTIDRSISGLVKVYLYAGSSSSGQIPSGYTGSVPNADAVFPNWTSGTHPMTNLVFALVSVDYNREKSVTGIANMLFQVESSMKQPGDVLYDYLTSTVYGAGIPTADIDTTSVSALTTYSAESVAYNDEGTGAQTLPDRYQINGLVDTDENVLRNAEQICSSTATWLSYDTHEGKWGVVINKAGTSAASFSDTNILGNISVGGTGLQDLYNSVKVEFPHRDLRDSADYIKIEIPANQRNANEPDNTLNITYDNINEQVQAEQLGFIELKQSRVDLVIEFETDFSYINLKAGDVIDVTNSRYGFTNKLFRIVTITERQDNDGALTMQVTALEYDADVYSVQSITRYTRSNADGIISIGAIGVSTTPQVTKFERNARPRIEIEVDTPSGVIEGLEYWVSFDSTETNDALRSYTLVGTKKPVGGGVFASGTTVVFEYANLNAQNFYVKVRGFNTTAVGPYSTPSGLVEFLPEQVPDAITPDTSVLDSTGGLATALGIVSLLNNLDGMFGSTPNSTGSLFEKIFDVFSDETGVDILTTAQDGIITGADVDTAVSDYFTANPPSSGTATPGESCSIYLVASGIYFDSTAIKTATPGQIGGDPYDCSAANFWTHGTTGTNPTMRIASGKAANQFLKIAGNYELKITGRGVGYYSPNFQAGFPNPTTVYGRRNYHYDTPLEQMNAYVYSAAQGSTNFLLATNNNIYSLSYNNTNPANTTTITYSTSNYSYSNPTAPRDDKFYHCQDSTDVNKWIEFKVTNVVDTQSGSYPNITYTRVATIVYLGGNLTTWPTVLRLESTTSINASIRNLWADFTAGEYLGCVGTKDQVNAFLATALSNGVSHFDKLSANGTVSTNTSDFTMEFVFKNTDTNTVVATNSQDWKYITEAEYNNPSGITL
tara:strand:+ start:179 stop:3298 length:3120 start_codon:yes stop_codon:yes gene_type:complete